MMETIQRSFSPAVVCSGGDGGRSPPALLRERVLLRAAAALANSNNAGTSTSTSATSNTPRRQHAVLIRRASPAVLPPPESPATESLTHADSGVGLSPLLHAAASPSAMLSPPQTPTPSRSPSPGFKLATPQSLSRSTTPDDSDQQEKGSRPWGEKPVRSCAFCGATSTPTWRRGPPSAAGKASLCNACGIKWRLKNKSSSPAISDASPSPAASPAPSPLGTDGFLQPLVRNVPLLAHMQQSQSQSQTQSQSQSQQYYRKRIQDCSLLPPPSPKSAPSSVLHRAEGAPKSPPPLDLMPARCMSAPPPLFTSLEQMPYPFAIKRQRMERTNMLAPLPLLPSHTFQSQERLTAAAILADESLFLRPLGKNVEEGSQAEVPQPQVAQQQQQQIATPTLTLPTLSSLGFSVSDATKPINPATRDPLQQDQLAAMMQQVQAHCHFMQQNKQLQGILQLLARRDLIQQQKVKLQLGKEQDKVPDTDLKDKDKDKEQDQDLDQGKERQGVERSSSVPLLPSLSSIVEDLGLSGVMAIPKAKHTCVS